MELISLSVCAGCCLLLVLNRSSIETIIGIAALYVTLHFAYTLPTMFVGEHTGDWIAAVGGARAAQLGGIVFVIVLTLITLRHIKDRQAWISLLPFLVMPVVFGIGFTVERCCQAVRWQDLMSVTGFFVLTGIVAVAASRCPVDRFVTLARRWLPLIAIVVLASVIAASYEVATLRAWAQFRVTSGGLLLRGSAWFFNPNWFGGWLVCVALLILALVGAVRDHAWLADVTGALVGVGLFLSGSRGAALTLLICWVLLITFGSGIRLRTIRSGIIIFCALFACAATFWLVRATGQPGSLSAVEPFSILALRWVSFPVELSIVAASFALRVLSVLQRELSMGLEGILSMLQVEYRLPIPPSWDETTLVTREFMESISGRITGNLRDNGFAAIYDEAGLLSMVVIVGFWTVLGAAALFAVARRPTRCAGAVAVSVLASVTLSGLQMRAFQVFPVWLASAVMVGLAVRSLGRGPDESLPTSVAAATRA